MHDARPLHAQPEERRAAGPTRRQFTEVRVRARPPSRVGYTRGARRADHRPPTASTTPSSGGSICASSSGATRCCASARIPAARHASYTRLPRSSSPSMSYWPPYVGGGEKVVLWSFYRASLDRLAARYARFGLVRIDGSVGDVAARRDAVRVPGGRRDDDLPRQPGGRRRRARRCTGRAVAVYESFSNQAAHFMQSLDRIHRRGQERDVEYVVLLCDGPIEEDEYAAHPAKVDAQADSSATRGRTDLRDADARGAARGPSTLWRLGRADRRPRVAGRRARDAWRRSRASVDATALAAAPDVARLPVERSPCSSGTPRRLRLPAARQRGAAALVRRRRWPGAPRGPSRWPSRSRSRRPRPRVGAGAGRGVCRPEACDPPPTRSSAGRVIVATLASPGRPTGATRIVTAVAGTRSGDPSGRSTSSAAPAA